MSEMEYDLGFREVVPDQNFQNKWQEIILTTGGSQSTLQDIKVPERAGGYSYQNVDNLATRNRFIYWRIAHDILELSEHSLDMNLTANRVKFRFTDTPVLDSISIHETDDMVLVLVATVSSVHKLSFPHPMIIQKQVISIGLDNTIQSIFSEAYIQNIQDPRTFFIVPTAGLANSPVAHAAASDLLMPHEKALFAFAFNTGTILLVRLDTVTGSGQIQELQIESTVPRFLSGIATAIRGKTSGAESIMSLVMHTYGEEMYLFTFCREGHLRIWSGIRTQCVAVIDVLTNNESQHQIIQDHSLRKITNSHEGLYLGTYVELDTNCEFSIFKLIEDPTYKVSRVCTFLAPKRHLVDFSFTSTRLWALWRLNDTDNVAVTYICLPLTNANSNCQWESVILTEKSDKDYISDPGIDPRQAYIDFLFHPGQFALTDIIKALNIYRRSNSAIEERLSPSLLKERVCGAVESEIQAEVIDYELMDEDYLEIVNRCWSKFYSCVLQYHMTRNRPVGFFLLPFVYGAVLLKKCSFSFLRPMEVLEYSMSCKGKLPISFTKELFVLGGNEDRCQDIIELMSVLVFLEENLSDDFKFSFKKDLYRLKNPNIIIEGLLSNAMFNSHEPLSDFDFQVELYRRLDNIKDLPSSIDMLLKIITYNSDQLNEAESNHNASWEEQLYSNGNYCFGSHLGVSVMSKIVTQIASMRFSICRNLLILQKVTIDSEKSFPSHSFHSIKSSLATKTSMIIQAYYVILWICEFSVSSSTSQPLIGTYTRRIGSVNSQLDSMQSHNKSFSLIEMFIKYGVKRHTNLLIEPIQNSALNHNIWRLGLFSYATFILQLIWPITENFCFPEWLLVSCQSLVIQEYVRLLNTWCTLNNASRKYILAMSLLDMGELHKASDNFLRASNGVVVDSYMSNLFFTEKLSKK